VREAGLAARVVGPTWSVTGIVRVLPDVGVTLTLPVYVPPGTLRGLIVTVRVAGVKLALAVALNQFPPAFVLETSEKLIEAPPLPESSMVWTVGPDALKVSVVGEGRIDRAPPILNVTGMVKLAKPAALTVMVALYMPGPSESNVALLK
jgi:hypothetical protein